MTHPAVSHARQTWFSSAAALRERASWSWAVVVQALVDLAAFELALSFGVHLAAAQLMSFAIGTLAALSLATVSIRSIPPAALPRRLLYAAAVALMAVLLRGGVLALLVDRAGVPPQLAILGAIVVSSVLTRFGYALTRDAGQPGVDAALSWRAIAIGLGAYAVLLRLAYAGQIELLPEEAYYWNYAQHLDIGYLDHPPMVAWLIRGGTVLFGDTQFGVRIGALLCAAVASIFSYRTTRELFDQRSALIALCLMQIVPAYFLGGLFLTPDAPLIAAWAAALYYLQRALLQDRVSGWLWAGVALGLGLSSKYTMLLLVPSALVFMLVDRPSRRWLGHWAPYLAAVIGLALFSPVIWWNLEHGWASFAFQTSRRLAEPTRFSLHVLIASVLVLLTPVGALSLPLALRSSTPPSGSVEEAGSDARRMRFFQVFTLVPLSMFVLFSLTHEVKFDWTEALWLAATPPLAHFVASVSSTAAGRYRRWLQSASVPTSIILLVLLAATLHYLALGLPGIGYSSQADLLPVAWRDLGRQIDAVASSSKQHSGVDPLIVGMNRYMLASELAFYTGESSGMTRQITSQHLFDGDALMYEQWDPKALQNGRTLLLVAWKADDLAEDSLASHVRSLGPLAEGQLRRDGRVFAHYFYRFADGYQSTPKPAGSL